MNLIINLLSDQTIPNLQFIKDFLRDDDEILFFTTNEMQKKGVEKWIIDAVNLSAHLAKNKIHTLLLSPFDINGMRKAMSTFNYEIYKDIYVNVTGGTKTMSLATFDFFKECGADIFYITGKDSQILKLFPNRQNTNLKVVSKISLKEYLTAYGFSISRTSLSGISMEYTIKFKDWFTNRKNEDEQKILSELQNNNRRDKGCLVFDIKGLNDLLDRIDFPIKDKNKLSKHEVKYLTGEWLEEYIYFKIKNDLGLTQDIETGLYLSKNEVRNEYDVILLFNNILYIIECKTYIINKSAPGLVTDTIYKRTALLKQLGLFGRNYIVTLNSESEIRNAQLERARDLDIKILGLESINSEKSFSELLNIPLNAH